MQVTCRIPLLIILPVLVLSIAVAAEPSASSSGETAPGYHSDSVREGREVYVLRGTIRRAPTDQCGEYEIDLDSRDESRLIYVGCSMPGDEASWELLVGQHVRANGTDMWRDHCTYGNQGQMVFCTLYVLVPSKARTWGVIKTIFR